MSRSTLHEQLWLNDGAGNNLPIQTGTWVSKAINMEEKRRLSISLGVFGTSGYNIAAGLSGFQGIPTGSFNYYGGGFTGTLLVQGTDEIAGNAGALGTQSAGAGNQPGPNGLTGALTWATIPSGNIAITNALSASGSSPPYANVQLISLTDVGPSWVRLAFNSTVGTGVQTATGTLGGSGTMVVSVTAKHT